MYVPRKKYPKTKFQRSLKSKRQQFIKKLNLDFFTMLQIQDGRQNIHIFTFSHFGDVRFKFNMWAHYCTTVHLKQLNRCKQIMQILITKNNNNYNNIFKIFRIGTTNRIKQKRLPKTCEKCDVLHQRDPAERSRTEYTLPTYLLLKTRVTSPVFTSAYVKFPPFV